jgi:hypothetical protein
VRPRAVSRSGKLWADGERAGNWAEDRAPEMKYGVYADYGFVSAPPQDRRGVRCVAVQNIKTSTAKDEYRKPSSYKDHFHGRRKGGGLRFGMVTPATVTEARISYGAGERLGSGFGGLIPTREATAETVHFESTSADLGRHAAPDHFSAAHARRERVGAVSELSSDPMVGVSSTAVIDSSHFGEMMRHSALAKPAGGPGNQRIDRGKATGGSMGEKYVELDAGPASKATAVQRSWYPSVDPAIAARHAINAGTMRKESAHDASFMSVSAIGGGGPDAGIVRDPAALGSSTAPWLAPRRKATITLTNEELSRKGGVRVFSDE